MLLLAALQRAAAAAPLHAKRTAISSLTKSEPRIYQHSLMTLPPFSLISCRTSRTQTMTPATPGRRLSRGRPQVGGWVKFVPVLDCSSFVYERACKGAGLHASLFCVYCSA